MGLAAFQRMRRINAAKAEAAAKNPAATDKAEDADLMKLTKAKLLEKAAELGLTLDGKATKAQIVEAIEGGASTDAPKGPPDDLPDDIEHLQDLTKAKLVEKAESMGIEVDKRATKAVIVTAIESAGKGVAATEAAG